MFCTATIKNAQFSEEIITLFNGQEAIEFYENLFQKKIANGENDYLSSFNYIRFKYALVSGWEF